MCRQTATTRDASWLENNRNTTQRVKRWNRGLISQQPENKWTATVSEWDSASPHDSENQLTVRKPLGNLSEFTIQTSDWSKRWDQGKSLMGRIFVLNFCVKKTKTASTNCVLGCCFFLFIPTQNATSGRVYRVVILLSWRGRDQRGEFSYLHIHPVLPW